MSPSEQPTPERRHRRSARIAEVEQLRRDLELARADAQMWQAEASKREGYEVVAAKIDALAAKSEGSLLSRLFTRKPKTGDDGPDGGRFPLVDGGNV